MAEMLMGGIATASFIVGLFFVRFWQATRDRLFIFFALSFWLEAINRVSAALMESEREESAIYFVVRLVAYALIIVAIVDKNKHPPSTKNVSAKKPAV